MSRSRREPEWPITSKRFASVLVILDGSDASWCALDAALALCQEADAQLTVLATEPHHAPGLLSIIPSAAATRRTGSPAAAGSLQAAGAFASYADVDLVADRTVPSWKAIARYAAAHRQDLIVLGWQRRLLQGHRVAARASRLAVRGRCPVMIVGAGAARDRVSD